MARADELAKKFRAGRWTAGVVGLGYVGLPLAVTITQAGVPCIGYDLSASVVGGLASGVSHIGDVDDSTLQKALSDGFGVTSDASRLSEADAIFICVPSPLGRNRQPDMSYIRGASSTVAGVLRSNQLISLESTSYPGTTRDVFLPVVAESGFELDTDVFVAFSSERVDPGNPRGLDEIPKVVGGLTRDSGRVAAAAYGRVVGQVHLVSSAETAEMAKLLENTYRAVNIGLINEMAQLAHELRINIWEVIDAAATKPFGYQPFRPGPGVGGHCIPLDPQFLAWRAKEARFATRFIDLAEQVNSAMPGYTASRVADVLNRRGLPTRGTRVLGVGMAYKPNVSDDRESPAIDVLAELRRRGAEVSVYDPLVSPEEISAHGFGLSSGTPSDLERFAIAVILTDHDTFDFRHIAEHVPVVFDARGAYAKRRLSYDNVIVL